MPMNYDTILRGLLAQAPGSTLGTVPRSNLQDPRLLRRNPLNSGPLRQQAPTDISSSITARFPAQPPEEDPTLALYGYDNALKDEFTNRHAMALRGGDTGLVSNLAAFLAAKKDDIAKSPITAQKTQYDADMLAHQGAIKQGFGGGSQQGVPYQNPVQKQNLYNRAIKEEEMRQPLEQTKLNVQGQKDVANIYADQNRAEAEARYGWQKLLGGQDSPAEAPGGPTGPPPGSPAGSMAPMRPVPSHQQAPRAPQTLGRPNNLLATLPMDRLTRIGSEGMSFSAPPNQAGFLNNIMQARSGVEAAANDREKASQQIALDNAIANLLSREYGKTDESVIELVRDILKDTDNNYDTLQSSQDLMKGRAPTGETWLEFLGVPPGGELQITPKDREDFDRLLMQARGRY